MYMLINQEAENTKKKIDRLVQIMKQPGLAEVENTKKKIDRLVQIMKQPGLATMDISCEKKKKAEVETHIVTRVEGSTMTISMGSVMARIIMTGPEFIPFRFTPGINLLQSNQNFCISTVMLGVGVSKKVQEKHANTEESINEDMMDASVNNPTERVPYSWTVCLNQGKNSLPLLDFHDMGYMEGPTCLSHETCLYDKSDPPAFELPSSKEVQLSSPTVAPISEARHRAMIKMKMDGSYVPMLERAQKFLGYEAQSKNKKNVKPKPLVKPSRIYMQTKNLLSEIQANLVVAAAGVELDETLQNKVVKAAMATPASPET